MTDTADQIWDVLIVGAGTTGLPAAICAGRRGARVRLIDSSDRIGGTLYMSSGSFGAACTRRQKEKGIEDSPQGFYDDCMRITHGTCDPVTLRLWTENAGTTMDWMMDAGVPFPDDNPQQGGAHEPYDKPRTFNPVGGGGAYVTVLEPMLQELIDAGQVTLSLNTRMTGLIRDASGAVTGAETDKGPILAKSVVLTSGGYGANAELWREMHDKPLYTYVDPHARGDGIIAARDVGAALRNDNFLVTFGGVHDIDVPGKYWLAAAVASSRRKPWEVFVTEEGKRFLAEDAPGPDARERAVLHQPTLSFWVIYDARVRRESPQYWFWPEEKVERAFALGEDFKTADTLEGLAQKMGVDPTVLQGTISDYNAAQASGQDPLGRQHMPVPIEEAPFYAFRVYGTNVVSWAGLAVDSELRVLDKDNKPIPNLYAGGEILGMGIFGEVFLGGSTIAVCMTFGQLLGDRFLHW